VAGTPHRLRRSDGGYWVCSFSDGDALARVELPYDAHWADGRRASVIAREWRKSISGKSLGYGYICALRQNEGGFPCRPWLLPV